MDLSTTKSALLSNCPNMELKHMDSCRTRNFALSFLLVLKQFTRALFYTTIWPIEHYVSCPTAFDNLIGVDVGSHKVTYDKFGKCMYNGVFYLMGASINITHKVSVVHSAQRDCWRSQRCPENPSVHTQVNDATPS